MSLASYLDIGGEPGRYPALDGLRAIAIFLVLCRHGFEAVPSQSSELLPEAISNVLQNGWLGVDLFFVLSGFLIGKSLNRAWKRAPGLDIKHYLIGRVLRTFPLYYAALILAFLQVVPYYTHAGGSDWRDLSHYILFLQDYLGAGILVPTWSLAIEEKFYLLAPLLAFLLVTAPRLGVLVLTVLVATAVTARYHAATTLSVGSYEMFFWEVRAPFHQAWDGIMIGLMMSHLPRFHVWLTTGWRAGPWSRVVLGVSIACVLAVDWLDQERWKDAAVAISVINLLFVCLVVQCATPGYSRSILGAYALRVLARLAYPLYLTHYLVIDWAWSQAGAGNVGMFLCWYLVLSIAGALSLHLLVEKPFLILKDSLRPPVGGGGRNRAESPAA